MANSYTIEQIANLCHNEIRMIGTLTEFAAESYVKNDVAVVKYKGVVECNGAFILIKATTTSFDDTFKPFVDEFNVDATGHKVFIIGKLNSVLGVNVDYIAIAYNDDYFESNIIGICNPYQDNVIIVNSDYHDILNLPFHFVERPKHIYHIGVRLNPVETIKNVIINDGFPAITWNGQLSMASDEIDNLEQIITQAIEEHEIYLEAIRQMKEGK